MTLSHGSDGLSVVYDGKWLVSNLTVSSWRPEPGWRFGFGARTSAAVDEHVLSGVEILADAFVEEDAVGVEVTLNGQMCTFDTNQPLSELEPRKITRLFCAHRAEAARRPVLQHSRRHM